MTLTPEQIKEAVELADGWVMDHLQTTKLWAYCPGLKNIPLYEKESLAALASQLISQVDVMDDIHVSTLPGATAIHKNVRIYVEGEYQHGYTLEAEVEGDNRDENSILACTKFLREKGNEKP